MVAPARGQWIWENGAVPCLDPFTYASGDRLWIDLQWLFELILAAAFAGGGVRGVILLAATVCATVLAVVLALRDRRWPVELVVACWLPALLVMSGRFVPRPEVFSLLWMAIYLMVLTRADGTPAAAWVLPPVQLLWVNTHGLFLLGPIILVAFLADRLFASSHRILGAARKKVRPRSDGGFISAVPRRWSGLPAWRTRTACMGPCSRSSCSRKSRPGVGRTNSIILSSLIWAN